MRLVHSDWAMLLWSVWSSYMQWLAIMHSIHPHKITVEKLNLMHDCGKPRSSWTLDWSVDVSDYQEQQTDWEPNEVTAPSTSIDQDRMPYILPRNMRLYINVLLCVSGHLQSILLQNNATAMLKGREVGWQHDTIVSSCRYMQTMLE